MGNKRAQDSEKLSKHLNSNPLFAIMFSVLGKESAQLAFCISEKGIQVTFCQSYACSDLWELRSLKFSHFKVYDGAFVN